METITCDPSEIRLSNHCVDRFLERFRPALDWSSAKRELLRLLGCGSVRSDAPSWLADRALQEADCYLTVGEDLVLPLVHDGGDWIARTCLGRGGISAPARERRNRNRRHRRSRRRGTRSRGHHEH